MAIGELVACNPRLSNASPFSYRYMAGEAACRDGGYTQAALWLRRAPHNKIQQQVPKAGSRQNRGVDVDVLMNGAELRANVTWCVKVAVGAL